LGDDGFAYMLKLLPDPALQTSLIVGVGRRRVAADGTLKDIKLLRTRRDKDAWQEATGIDAVIRDEMRCFEMDSNPEPMGYGGYSPPVPTSAEFRGLRAYAATRALVSCGRCYLWAVGDKPLQWGAAREGVLHWQFGADGRQRLLLQPADVVLLFEPCCYVDLKLGEVGPLRLDLPEDLIGLLASAPALLPEEVQGFVDAFPEALAAHIPAPTPYPVRQESSTPQAALAVRREAHAAGGSGMQLVGQLQYRYGSQVLAAAAPEATHEGPAAPTYVLDGDTVVRYQRDPQAEQRAAAKLQGAGWEVLGGQATRQVADLQDVGDPQHSLVDPLRQLGWEVHTEGDLDNAVVYADETAWDADVEEQEGGLWFSLAMDIHVGGKPYPLLPILKHALSDPAWGLNPDKVAKGSSKHVYVPLGDGKTVGLQRTRLAGMMSVIAELYAENPRLGLGQAEQLMEMGQQVRLRGNTSLFAMARRLKACTGVNPASAPANLAAELRPYQLQGLSWLQFLREHQLGGILADDMGLGKTLQTLSHLLEEKQSGRLKQPALVVVPTSLLTNWQREAARFAPDLRVGIYYGPDRLFDKRRFREFDVIVSSYGVVLRDY
jgi:hypothetical protein